MKPLVCLQVMEESFKKSCTYSEQFYTGYTDRKENKKWLNYNDKQALTLDDWEEDFPKNYTQHDCVMKQTGRHSVTSSTELC